MEGFETVLRDCQVAGRIQGFPQIFHVAFGLSEPPRNYRDLMGMDRARYVRFCGELLKRRVRVLERGAWFLSSTHDSLVIEETLEAVAQAASEVQR